MNCISCKMEVSPNFVAAIAENKCPACGKQLLDTSDYKKIFALKKLLSALNLGLADPMLVKLSAAINSKFELWPKESGNPPQIQDVASPPVQAVPVAPQEAQADPVLMQRQKQQMINKLSKAMDAAADQSIDVHELDDDQLGFEEDADLSPAEKAKLMQEFGLSNDESGVQLGHSTSPQMVKELSDMISAESFPIEENAAMTDRMSRARGLQGQVRASAMSGGANRFGIRPIVKVGDR